MAVVGWLTIAVLLPAALAVQEEVKCPQNCECLGTVESFSVACTGSSFTSLPDGLPEGLSALYMRHTEITSLPGGVFSKYSSLKRLLLSNNKINTVDAEAFKGLSNLELLMLNENELNDLPDGVFTNLDALKSLDLSGNKFTTVKDKLWNGLSSLQWLSLVGNRIETLPCNAFKGLRLKGLSLEDNSIKDFPDCVLNGLSVLRDLKISNNKIADLSARNFRQVPSVQHLSLSKNSLSDLTADLFKDLPKLKTLGLAGNKFQKVPTAAFGNLKNLEQLILTENPISVIKTAAFVGLDNLQNLYMRRMPELQELQKEAFGGMPNLVNLAVEENKKLKTLPMTAFPSEQLTNLNDLYVSSNAIEQFDKNLFVNLHSLQMTALDGNPLKCDCNARWLHDNKVCTATWAAEASGRGATCFTPKTLRGISVTDVDVYDLTCQPPLVESTTSEKITVPPGGKTSFQAILSRGVPTFAWLTPSGESLKPGDVKNPGAQNEIKVTQEQQADKSIKATMTLNDLTEEADGNYVLVATNIAGGTTTDYQLTVKEKLLQAANQDNSASASSISTTVIVLLVGLSVSVLLIVGVVIRRKFMVRQELEYRPLIPEMDSVKDYGVRQ